VQHTHAQTVAKTLEQTLRRQEQRTLKARKQRETLQTMENLLRSGAFALAIKAPDAQPQQPEVTEPSKDDEDMEDVAEPTAPEDKPVGPGPALRYLGIKSFIEVVPGYASMTSGQRTNIKNMMNAQATGKKPMSASTLFPNALHQLGKPVPNFPPPEREEKKKVVPKVSKEKPEVKTSDEDVDMDADPQMPENVPLPEGDGDEIDWEEEAPSDHNVKTDAETLQDLYGAGELL
jgi:hypothetical protein